MVHNIETAIAILFSYPYRPPIVAALNTLPIIYNFITYDHYECYKCKI